MLYRIRPRGHSCFMHEIPSSIWEGNPWSAASESSWVMQPPKIVSPVYFIYIDIHTPSHTYIYIYICLYLYKSHWINVGIVPEHVPYLVFTGECLFLCHCPELLLVTLYIHADTAKGIGLYRDGWWCEASGARVWPAGKRELLRGALSISKCWPSLLPSKATWSPHVWYVRAFVYARSEQRNNDNPSFWKTWAKYWVFLVKAIYVLENTDQM